MRMLPRFLIAFLIAGVSLAAAAFASDGSVTPAQVEIPAPRHGDTVWIEDTLVLTFQDNQTVLLADGSYTIGSVMHAAAANGSGMAAYFVERQPVGAANWGVEEGVRTGFGHVQPQEIPYRTTRHEHVWADGASLCGVHHGLQGRVLEEGLVLTGTGTCGGLSRFVVLSLSVRQDAAIATVEEHMETGKVETHRLLDGVPYPLDWATGAQGTITGFARGDGQAALPVLPAPVEWSLGIDTPMDLSGIDYPYPFEQAWADALSSPTGLEFLRFLQEHPSAYVAAAELGRSKNNDADWDHWNWVVSDGTESLAVKANRQTHRLPETVPDAPTVVHVRTSEDTTPRPPAPTPLPRAADLLRAADLEVAHPEDALPRLAWSIACVSTCSETTTSYAGGWFHSDPQFTLTRGTASWDFRHHWIEGKDGQILLAGSSVRDDHPEPAGTSPAPTGMAAALSTAQSTLPASAIAAGAAVAGVGAAILYLLWPILKHLPVFGLFSRITREKALDNPARQELHDLVTAEPGIHFQELARRLGRGQGTTSHHMDHLVRSGLVVRRRGRGFTCYFPRGTSAATMAAAPVSKSGVARALLEATRQEPGITASQIAQQVGVSQATMSYHTKRLEEAGLIHRRREGVRVRLFAVPSTPSLAPVHGSA